MNFDKFLLAAADPELRKKAMAGFSERQAERERRFAEEDKKRRPSDQFYRRRYDI